ncbi:hypothetical protein, partial [Xanthomonas sacchari]|uniref:hypothetical protein n=1 Tax=Xanthomonas sacchari TaxID=56458 RepID=UPI00225E6F0D
AFAQARRGIASDDSYAAARRLLPQCRYRVRLALHLRLALGVVRRVQMLMDASTVIGVQLRQAIAEWSPEPSGCAAASPRSRERKLARPAGVRG